MQEGKKDLLRFLAFQKHFVSLIFNVNTNIVIIHSNSIIHIEVYNALNKCVLVYERSSFLLPTKMSDLRNTLFGSLCWSRFEVGNRQESYTGHNKTQLRLKEDFFHLSRAF